ncbi:MAG: oxygenase MpaB family protein [Acidimicrobiales bacterium]
MLRTDPRVQPRPIELDSLLWRYAGDRRLAFVGLSAGLLQLMHPGIGAGVAEHSRFFTEPWERIERSLPEILGVIYDPEPERTGHRVRGYHQRIRGVDHMGRPYRALAPESYWWAHATFQWSVEQLIDRFARRRLGVAEREQLYDDGVEWYRRYGVSMRPVPPDHRCFVAAWEQVCANQLELTPAADRAIDMAVHATLDLPPSLPPWITTFGRPVVLPLLQLCAIGGLPPLVRQRFGIPWSLDDELRYRGFQLWVREVWRFVPAGARYHPRAAAGRLAAQARMLSSSPEQVA